MPSNRWFALLLSLPILAAATISQCTTGSLLCCNITGDVKKLSRHASLQYTPLTLTYHIIQANDKLIRQLLDLLEVPKTVQGLVGVSCNPITVLGAGSGGCNAQVVCCTDNSYGGTIALGCTPVNINN
ncbi:hypothetical protein CVT26_014687 [Gymnopilus dilepis]|uniref:Hydrophobin n=1 Tax=Gymnopilus dilepis TaxID=231916 RepID=A0A409W3C3_9AGAR|nr:hypothetical protein CVT26_014687 [Gymnopilus dilepis]